MHRVVTARAPAEFKLRGLCGFPDSVPIIIVVVFLFLLLGSP